MDAYYDLPLPPFALAGGYDRYDYKFITLAPAPEVERYYQDLVSFKGWRLHNHELFPNADGTQDILLWLGLPSHPEYYDIFIERSMNDSYTYVTVGVVNTD